MSTLLRMYQKEIDFESNLMLGLKFNDLDSILELSVEKCPKCLIHKKNHYCIQPGCPKKQLICVECDTNPINSNHYMHDFTFIAPLFSKNIFSNFYTLRQRFQQFLSYVAFEINNIQDYLQELRKIQKLTELQMDKMKQEEKQGKIGNYIDLMESFLKERRQDSKLSEVLKGVSFMSGQQCQLKEQQIKTELLASINTLRYPKDPQKILKEKLKEQIVLQKNESFLSAHKTISLTEIDSTFRNCNQYLTDQLSHHKIDIKLENDILSKYKYYESFIYHFRNCSKLSIQGAQPSHLRTPLTFKKLKQLQFYCNVEVQTQTPRLEGINCHLTKFVIKRLREEDIKILKHITEGCVNLKSLQLCFQNKTDLSTSRQLLEFLKAESKKNLLEFCIKIRTESQVKRMYGYLTKFYRDIGNESPTNLNTVILELMTLNRCMTKVIIEGVRPFDVKAAFQKLTEMPFLMDYKIYYETIDLMTEIDIDEVRKLEDMCYKRKRVFYALARASKFKRLSKPIIQKIVGEYLV